MRTLRIFFRRLWSSKYWPFTTGNTTLCDWRFELSKDIFMPIVLRKHFFEIILVHDLLLYYKERVSMMKKCLLGTTCTVIVVTASNLLQLCIVLPTSRELTFDLIIYFNWSGKKTGPPIRIEVASLSLSHANVTSVLIG